MAKISKGNALRRNVYELALYGFISSITLFHNYIKVTLLQYRHVT